MKAKIFFITVLILGMIAVSNLMNVSAFAQIKLVNEKQDVIASKPPKNNSKRSRREPLIERKDRLNIKNNHPLPASSLRDKNQRGESLCEVFFGNSTGWIIKTYINGNYRGAIGAYDDATIYIEQGKFTVYARADFKDGTYKYWGPKEFNCVPNRYPPLRISLGGLEPISPELRDNF